ncbi:MAG: hypothetical protein ACE366_11590 [Bradymonadia bacterium]
MISLCSLTLTLIWAASTADVHAQAAPGALPPAPPVLESLHALDINQLEAVQHARTLEGRYRETSDPATLIRAQLDTPEVQRAESTPWHWITVGAGAALLGTSGYYSYRNERLGDELLHDPSNEALYEDVDRTHKMGRATLVTGGILAASGLLWAYLNHEDQRPAPTTGSDRGMGWQVEW